MKSLEINNLPFLYYRHSVQNDAFIFSKVFKTSRMHFDGEDTRHAVAICNNQLAAVYSADSGHFRFDLFIILFVILVKHALKIVLLKMH